MNNVITLSRQRPELHLAEQGIRTVKDLQIRLQEVFENHEHQNSVLVQLYKMLFPDWDKIKRIEGFPEVGVALWQYICNLFIEFDRIHHPDILKGGAWINQGFSSNDRLSPWEISLENCNVIYS